MFEIWIKDNAFASNWIAPFQELKDNKRKGLIKFE